MDPPIPTTPIPPDARTDRGRCFASPGVQEQVRVYHQPGGRRAGDDRLSGGAV